MEHRTHPRTAVPDEPTGHRRTPAGDIPSLLAASAWKRVSGALTLVALLWLAVAWALA